MDLGKYNSILFHQSFFSTDINIRGQPVILKHSDKKYRTAKNHKALKIRIVFIYTLVL